MAAGLGYKEFATGDVLTAADANGYLASQVVMVFASAAARTSAIASPQEGMISYLKDTNSTEYYSGSAWVAIGGAGGGKVLQVVSTNKTDTFSTSSTSLTDLTGLSVSITPSSASSKILVFTSINYSIGVTVGQAYFQLLRGATAIAQGDAAGSRSRTTSQGGPAYTYLMTNYSLQFLDSPATTSTTTYKIQTRVTNATCYVNRTEDDTDSAVYPRGISTITVMEIAA